MSRGHAHLVGDLGDLLRRGLACGGRGVEGAGAGREGGARGGGGGRECDAEQGHDAGL